MEKTMTQQEIITVLFRELLFVALFLLGILFINNIVLYKQKIKDRLSLMLLFAMIMCGFELLWSFSDGNPQLKALTYFGVCGYMMSFVFFSVLFNRYILGRFERLPKRRWMTILFYIVPLGIFFLFCLTTPLTHWLIEVDQSGVLQERVLFNALFMPLMMIYLLIALISAVEYAIRGHRKHLIAIQVAYSMIVFGVMAPVLYILELVFMGTNSDFLALSLPISISLVFLVTQVSTNTLLESRAKIEATESELNVATKIQADMLPRSFLRRKEFELFASMEPAKEVGGDFYDFFMIDDDHLALVIGDVSGKGVPAALFMVISKTLIKDHAAMNCSPKELLEKVNNMLIESNEENMFVTVWFGILEISTGKITAANAGHEYPVLRSADGYFELLQDKHGLVVGVVEGICYHEYEIQLEKGDCLFVYTDGVPEATDKDNNLYGTDRMVDALNKDSLADPKTLITTVKKDVDSFVGNAPQFDDMTMLCIELKDTLIADA